MKTHVTSHEMAALLNISTKTLHRYRAFEDERRFLKPGVHFFKRTIESREFIWDAEKTTKAYWSVMGKEAQTANSNGGE